MSLIELKDLCFTYQKGMPDEKKAVQDVNLTIEAGQFGVFPAEKWHRIEALSDDTVFNVDFWVDPKVLIEG